MRFSLKHATPLLPCIAIAGLLLVNGCAQHPRYYDAYYTDYHTWNHGEVVYYNRWEHDTHRDHEDFAKRNEQEKKEYYTWRHNQNGNDKLGGK